MANPIAFWGRGVANTDAERYPILSANRPGIPCFGHSLNKHILAARA